MKIHSNLGGTVKNFFKKMSGRYEESFITQLDQFEDPIAKSIDWSPLKRGGTNFKTHKLINDVYRMQYKATMGAMLFGGVFLLFGAGIPGWILYENFKQDNQFLMSENIFIIGFGLVFLAVGIFLIRKFATPITFDKHIGYFWRGNKEPEMYSMNNPKEAIRLSAIYALQLISERVKSDKGSYFSYELNIITKEGKRINVIDHGDRQSIYNDAKTLSEFLNVSVWDLNKTF